ncbi:cytochrome c oxidase accessory protein FixG [Parasphingorhabdus marina DSM 22363]|uniref:Cytochrome c oxidase accessory protein FixG n=1 Tax=Parasphingorhabdus marina DSM 22363 TaxID=1123272 RepID=A0A1N6HIQ4_9SPHN|nr:cytochrome c oxidase accessory protein CcoG [Parasphingorhabdus marina]SIO19728.1 cytochrome c oxidase accessory protein FixG [Parasphingorhabdus marina DSM 22363]
MNNPDEILDPELKLYEARKAVHPQRIDGTFRRLKWAIMIVTLAIYYITPWIRWDRGPYAPNQAVLVDLANRRFYMFGIEIWPHEFYYVAGLLVMAGIGLFLVTSAVGRAWCGYACPQTVWTDLFQHVDRFVDGDRNARMRMDKAPWTAKKTVRRLFKWGIYLFIAFWTGGAWIMYFADAPTLVVDFWTGEAAFVAYATVGILTATTFIFGGFMREQVCVYMCPWPRIQAAMMDEKSLQVTYKDWRGEKRGSIKKAQKDPAAFGDCVDCNQCVAVCPTGIDIREGPQIGCITCALCIDACDRVMGEVGRPRGLIDYITADDAEAEKAGKETGPAWKNLLRLRTLVYFGVWAGIGLAMLFALGNRTRLDLAVQHDRNPVYVQLSNGDIRNAYTAKIRNMENRPRQMNVSITGLPGATLWEGGTSRPDQQTALEVTVPADSVANLRLFIAAPETTSERDEFVMTIEGAGENAESDSEELFFERPKN